jgi:hypothetical protein
MTADRENRSEFMVQGVTFFGLSGLKWLSILACLLILVGVACRRRRIHVPLMLAALTIDLSIVAVIEFGRGAVESAKNRMGPLMAVHIAISVLVLVLYAVQIWTGIQNLRGRRSRWHRYSGVSFVVLRLGNLVTSFAVTS